RELKQKEEQLEKLLSPEFAGELSAEQVLDYFKPVLSNLLSDRALLESEILKDLEEVVNDRYDYNRSIGLLDAMTNATKMGNGQFNDEALSILNTGNMKVPAGFKQLSQYHFYMLSAVQEAALKRAEE